MKYICHYDNDKNVIENRHYSPAAKCKIEYIYNKFNNINININIISPSVTCNTFGSFNKKCYKINDNTEIKLFKSVGFKNKILRFISCKITHLKFFFDSLLNIKKGETILVYHSLFFINMLKFLKQFKKIKLILQVEEIYGDVTNSEKDKKREFKLFKLADAFIFSTELLNEKVNTVNKPYAIAHGNYKIEPKNVDKFADGKIHCVYAGTLDPRKGGALAVAAAEFLNANYVIHILGFGDALERDTLCTIIEKINCKSQCKVIYEGTKSGQDYINFIQSCHIGLSTQNPNAPFNDTSFPSKILSYLSNGLRVVSIKIRALETSKVNELLFYYENDSAEEIANAIKSIDFTQEYNSRNLIEKLDKEFEKDLNKLLKETNERI